MPYDIKRWPHTVYPGEVNDECPEALPMIDVLILRMREAGPSPPGYPFKNLGRRKKGLWQINLKVIATKRQVRVLYAPYGSTIVLFRIHKKASPQEQDRAYDLAIKRRRDYESARDVANRNQHDRHRTIH